MTETETAGRRFADSVRAMRLARGLTPSEAAQRAGFSTAYWLRVESSPAVALQVRVSTMTRIAKALRCGIRLNMPPNELTSR